LLEGPSLLAAAELERKLSENPGPIYTPAPLPQFPQAQLVFPSARRLAEIARDQIQEIPDSKSLEPIYLREPHITVPKASRVIAMNR
jgi:hypothetical protein